MDWRADGLPKREENTAGAGQMRALAGDLLDTLDRDADAAESYAAAREASARSNNATIVVVNGDEGNRSLQRIGAETR
jgi:hypothetical protein